MGDTQWCVTAVDDTPIYYEIEIRNSNLTNSVIKLKISRELILDTAKVAIYNGVWDITSIKLKHLQTQKSFIDWLKGLNIWQS